MSFPIPEYFNTRVTIKLKSGESICLVLGQVWCLDEAWLLWQAMCDSERPYNRIDYIVIYTVEDNLAVHCWTWGIPMSPGCQFLPLH